MAKIGKILLITTGIILVGGTAYVVTKKIKTSSVSKSDQAAFIATAPAAGINNAAMISTLMGYGDDYINAWYNALKSGNSVFVLAGKGYSVNGGEAIQQTVAGNANNSTTGTAATQSLWDKFLSIFTQL